MSNSRITVLEAPRLQGGTIHRGWPQGPRREGPQGEIKITNTLVEIPRDAASDAGSTPAASTIPCIRKGIDLPPFLSSVPTAVVKVNRSIAEATFLKQVEFDAGVIGESPLAGSHHDRRHE